MTCKPPTWNPDTDREYYKTNCRRCGRPMILVKGKVKHGDDIIKENEWIDGDSLNQDNIFSKIFGLEKTYEVSDELYEKIEEFKNNELHEWHEMMEKVIIKDEGDGIDE